MGLKALSKAVLQGNRQGNHVETSSFLTGNRKETESDSVETLSFPAGSGLEKPEPDGRNRGKIGKSTTEEELFNLIRSAFKQIDLAGRPWTDWRKTLTPEKRQRLKEVEQRIDSTFATFDRPGLLAALEEYRSLTITNKN